MATLADKNQVKNELKKAGINISLSRSGYNFSNLVHETYGFFVVNALKGTELRTVINFRKIWDNISISINK